MEEETELLRAVRDPKTTSKKALQKLGIEAADKWSRETTVQNYWGVNGDRRLAGATLMVLLGDQHQAETEILHSA